jgi:GNAT superfamily N-acetyltransferase
LTPSELEIVDVAPHDDRMLCDALPVLQELRPHLTPESFSAIYQEGYTQGLRFTVAYRNEECVGVAGWRVLATTVAGRKLYVDDLVTTESGRSTGVGKALLAALIQRADQAGCTVLDLDSGVHRFDAHRFYMREAMAITAHHFTKRVGSPGP